MNTFEIEETVARDRSLKNIFLGVFACDKLPTVDERPACFIANTDPSYEPGEHWVAMFFDKYIEYFDSYGLQPRYPFNLYNPEIINPFCLQNINSIVCGEYCIYYLLKRAGGIESKRIFNDLRKRTDSDRVVKKCIDKFRVTGCLNTSQSCPFRSKL